MYYIFLLPNDPYLFLTYFSNNHIISYLSNPKRSMLKDVEIITSYF